MGLYDFLNNVPNKNNQNNQPAPIPWNARGNSHPVQAPSQDWNARSPTPTTGQGGFFNSNPFPNVMNWQQNMQSAPQPQPSTPSGGFFSNLWNGVKGAAGVVGGKIDQFEHATGLNHVAGAMKGVTNPQQYFPLQHHDDTSYLGAYKNMGSDFLTQFKNLGKSAYEGFVHPDEVSKSFSDKSKQVFQNLDPVSRFAMNLMAQSTTDPLSYVPVGGIAKALGTGIKTVSDATKLTPIVNAASSALRNAPMIKPAINNSKDILGNLFQKYYGASPDLVKALNEGAGAHAANQYNIINHIKSLAKDHGLSESELHEIGPSVEKTLVGPQTVEQQAMTKNISDLLKHGAPNTNTGTSALTHAISAVTGDPLLATARTNYFPHQYNQMPDELKGVFPKQSQGVPGLSPQGTYNMQRTFDTLADAEHAGLKPELDPFKVAGEHLSQTSKALTNNDVISNIKAAHGLLFDKDPIDEVSKLLKTGRMSADQAAAHLGMSVEDLKKGFVQSKVPQLSGAYIRPADEKALTQFLERAPKDSAYDKAVQLWKKVTLLNPAVHGHNIAYNGMYLGGAKPSYVAEHMVNLKSGTTDHWVDRAIKAGAISQDGGSFSKSLASASKTPNPIKDNVGYALHGALWDADKALRTSVFREAVEKGATDTEAAAKANKFLVNYNNTTPFENSVMKRVFPFYSWMKGNLPLQAEQMINNTPKQLFTQNATNAASQAISGEDSKDGKIGTGKVLPDGSEVKIDPYIPSSEPGKVADQGLLPFLYGHSNPILKEILSQVLNKTYYPSASLAPNGKESMANSDITNPEAPAGYNLLKRGVHAADSILPLSGVVGSAAAGALGDTDSRGALNNLVGLPNKDKPATTLLELITKALGGFSSRSNPITESRNEQYNQKDSLLNHIKYLKETGQHVSKAESRAAYRKVR